MGKGRIPSLDGLRAISIAFVIACHAATVMQGNGRLPFVTGLLGDWGSVGVTVFFVISGFLITTLLCDEFREPAPFAAILLRAPRVPHPACLLDVSRARGRAERSRRHFCLSCGFRRGDFVRHGLSEPRLLDPRTLMVVSVEEQFYLLWPFALAVRARGATDDRRNAAYAHRCTHVRLLGCALAAGSPR